MSNSPSRDSQPGDEEDELSAVLARETVDVSPSRKQVKRLREKFCSHDCRADTSTLDLQIKHLNRDAGQVQAPLIGLCQECDWVDFEVLRGEIEVELTFAGDPKHVEGEET